MFPDDMDVDKWKLGLRTYRIVALQSGVLNSIEELSPYILYMNRKLELSYGEYNNPSYLFADTLMKYIAFNQGGLLDLLNDYPYVLPEKSDYYGAECEGMHG